MPHGCLPQLKANLYVIAAAHSIVFDSMFHPPYCYTTTIRHARPHGMATNSAYTKPCIYLLEPAALSIPKICNHTQPINCYMIPEKDTMVSYMVQKRRHLNNQVLAVFFPSSTKPATLHCSKSIDKYSPQYGS